MVDEKLTDEERALLAYGGGHTDTGCKALRIIDAHAADRAALVAQLEALKRRLNEASTYCEECENRADVIGNLEDHIDEQKKRIVSLESADAVAGDHLKELVAQVAELTRERDEARAELAQREYSNPFAEARGINIDVPSAQEWEQVTRNVNKLLGETELERKRLAAEVTCLTDELAAVNADAKQWARDAERYLGERNSAEARARELEAELAGLVSVLREHNLVSC